MEISVIRDCGCVSGHVLPQRREDAELRKANADIFKIRVTFIYIVHKGVEKFNNYFMNFKALLIIIIVAFALLWIRAI
jgi:hypothetical protein